jgi:hypothetical protein
MLRKWKEKVDTVFLLTVFLLIVFSQIQNVLLYGCSFT